MTFFTSQLLQSLRYWVYFSIISYVVILWEWDSLNFIWTWNADISNWIAVIFSVQLGCITKAYSSFLILYSMLAVETGIMKHSIPFTLYVFSHFSKYNLMQTEQMNSNTWKWFVTNLRVSWLKVMEYKICFLTLSLMADCYTWMPCHTCIWRKKVAYFVILKLLDINGTLLQIYKTQSEMYLYVNATKLF